MLIVLFFASLPLLSQQKLMSVHLKNGNTYVVPVSQIGKITFEDTTTSVSDKFLPVTNILSDVNVFPNPMSNNIKIEYNIAVERLIDIEIINSNGTIIKDFGYRYDLPGEQSEVWDGKDFSGNYVTSGYYFIVFNAGNQKLVKKIILIN